LYIDRLDARNYLPLDCAISHRHKEIAIWIINQHLALLEKDSSYRIPHGEYLRLFAATGLGWNKIIRSLIPLGHSPEERSSVGASFATSLHGAAGMGSLRAIDILLWFGAKINALDTMKKTPLLWAIENNQYEAALVLIEAGADVALAPSGGDTALHLAAEQDSV
jgi:ankyrin repeat protein